jgi:hypothetical protein
LKQPIRFKLQLHLRNTGMILVCPFVAKKSLNN